MIEFGPPIPPQKGCHQTSKSPVCHALGSCHSNREIPPSFRPIWSQIELPAEHCGHSGGLFATLGQSALPRPNMDPSTGFCTLSWLQLNTILDLEGNPLCHKEDWPARSPDLSPLDYSTWSILENKVCSTSHPTVEALKARLLKEWAAIPQEALRAACASLTDKLKAVVKNKRSYIE